MTPFVDRYLADMSAHMEAISGDEVDRVGRRLLQTAAAGAQIFLAGNGGSASTASHFACDLAKTVLGAEPERRISRFRAVSLADNTALMTAWANDVSYESVFSEQIRMLGRPGDVLCVISASGRSPNVVEAVNVANEMGLHTLAMLGCDGGVLKDRVDDHVLVRCDDYGHVESAHMVLTHLLTEWLSEQLDAAPSSGIGEVTG